MEGKQNQMWKLKERCKLPPADILLQLYCRELKSKGRLILRKETAFFEVRSWKSEV